ncbi:MAG: undecaprenyldiphospho-muramoylpentapeptide beta-N-acetylglucosaminyltransferase [Candidatus Zixiibacteriota bacterium]
MRVLFAGGGTGGHLFPAIAIAEEIKRLDGASEIEFIGTEYGIEYRMKDTLEYKLHVIAMRGMPRKLSLGLLLFPFRLMKAVRQCKVLIQAFKPDIVVGTGGYVAGPPIMAAAKLGIPSVLQEQNSYPGLVTRKLAAKTTMLFLAYKRAEQYLPQGVRHKRLGNPIRRSVTTGNRADALRKFGLREDRKTILILGGSQGAHRLNEAVLRSMDKLDATVQILWQCGKRDYTEVAERLNKKDFVVSLFPFSNDMASVYAAADFAVARAGALTIAELTACGIPAILVPYPHATADHQTHNAKEVVDAGAAEMVADNELENHDIIARAMEILKSDKLSAMKQAAANIGRPDAAELIARDILALAKGEKLAN